MRRSYHATTLLATAALFLTMATQPGKASAQLSSDEGLSTAETSGSQTSASQTSLQGWSKIELGTGYSFASVDRNVGFGDPARINANGWDLTSTLDVNPWLSAEFNFANVIHSNSSSVLSPDLGVISGSASERHYTYTFGPRFVLNRGVFRPYAHVLVGADHQTQTVTASAGGFSVNQRLSDNAFAAMIGGGLEMPITRHLGLSAEGDYLLTRHAPPAAFTTLLGISSDAVTQNSFRASVGIVLRLGNGFEQSK